MHIISIDQRRVERIVNGIGDTFLSGRTTDIHDGHAAFLERIAHIGKVGIDISRHGDNLRYSTRSVCHYVIGLTEGIEQVKLRINLFQFLVIDDEQRIHMFRQPGNAGHRFFYLLLALERKGNSNDTNGQNTHLLRHFSHNG